MTKIATATAAVRLADQGMADFDAPVSTYFPPVAVVAQPTPITVRHLLNPSEHSRNSS